MATKAYWSWVSAGRPFTKAQPIADLEAWAIRNGIPVLGTIGNEEHLQADRPQDHTPFPVTAWPVPLPGYIGTAIDLANVDGLGQKFEDAARRNELPWLKYMNHSGQHLDSRDLDGDGLTWEEYPSSDRHVHLSIRTDWIFRSIGRDPFGGATAPATGGNSDMPKIICQTENLGWWLTDCSGREGIQTEERLNDLRRVCGDVVYVGNLDHFGPPVKKLGSSVVMTPEDRAAIEAAVARLADVVDANTKDAVADFGEGGAPKVRAD